MLNKITNLIVAEDGQGLTEYALLLAVVVVVVVAALGIFKGTISNMFNNVNNKVNDAFTTGIS